MYRANVASASTAAPSYAAAVANAKESLRLLGVAKLDESATVNASGTVLYRSAKTRARVAADLYRQGLNILDAASTAKFPRIAGNVTVRVRNIPVSIAKV